MTPVAVVLFVSLLLASVSMAAPALPRPAPTTVASVSTSTLASISTDVPPTPVFTFGPSGLPHASAPSAPARASSSLVLEMDWLS